MAARTVAMTCPQSSAVHNDDRSIPSRSAGSMAARGGGKSCTARGRNRCGSRSSRIDNACALSGRAARSGTRRLGLRMPRGRPRGVPELPLAKRPRASRARGRKGSGPSDWDSGFGKQQGAGRNDFRIGDVTVAQFYEVSSHSTFLIRSRQGPTLRRPRKFGQREPRGLWLCTAPRDCPKETVAGSGGSR